MSYATQTTVSPERSRMEIEATLKRYGAAGFMYGTTAEKAMIAFAANGRQVRFILPMPDPKNRSFTHYRRKNSPFEYERTENQVLAACEQELRRRWRALALAIKAKLEAVQSGITSFESEFLAHIVVPGGRTLGEELVPRLEEIYEAGRVPALPWEGE